MKNLSMIALFVPLNKERESRQGEVRLCILCGHASIDFVYILIKLYPSSVAIEGVLPT
jgi:hypothetical protein